MTVAGLRLAEPATLLTDYLLAGVAIMLAWRLLRVGPSTSRLWAGALIAGAVAALAGGTVHGFATVLPALPRTVLWKTALTGAGLASALLLGGTTRATLLGRASQGALLFAAGKLALYLAVVTQSDDFRYAAWDAAATIVTVLVLELVGGGRCARRLSWVGLALAVTTLGLVVQRFGLGLHPGFNHNDLYHLLQTLALWPFYRAALLLGTMNDRT